MRAIATQVLVSLIAIGTFGCASGLDPDGAGSGGKGSGAAGATESTGSFAAGTGGGAPGCSPDLHSVTDASGNVIQTCPPDQGCSNGQCVPACGAAGENKGNVGCDFLVPTPLFLPGSTQPCFAVFVANNWPKAAKLDVSFQGAPLDPTTFGRIPNGSKDPKDWPAIPPEGLPPDEVAVLFLSADPYSENGGTPLTCPVPPALSKSTSIGNWSLQEAFTGRGGTFHIQTDFPVSAYDILPFGGALSFLPGAELILPTTAWGTNYVPLIPATQVDPDYPFLGAAGGPNLLQLVAVEGGTKVEVAPSHFAGYPSGDDVVEAPYGKVTTFTLDAGQVIQWSGLADPSGSIFKSDKPVAVFGGNAELCLHSKTDPYGGGCDSAHAQVPPVSAMGFDYGVAPYTTRRADLQDESVLYRIVGTVDGTTLTYDPPVADAPTTLGVGEWVEFEAVGAFRVKSQDESHPFLLAQEMSGGIPEGGQEADSRPGVTPGAIENGRLGDEDFVIVLPPEQYQSRYVFFTDPTYGTTNLVLVRVRSPDGFHDVSVECLDGPVQGWKPIGSDQQLEYAEVDLVRVTPLGKCTNGRQVASSDGRFGLVVWGLDAWASYAYPAGAAVAPINEVTVDPVPK